MSKYEDTCVLKKLLAAGKNLADFIKNNTELNKIKLKNFCISIMKPIQTRSPEISTRVSEHTQKNAYSDLECTQSV